MLAPRYLETIIEAQEAGQTVGNILHRKMQLSIGAIRRVKFRPDGSLTLDGQPVYTNVPVREGQCLRVVVGDLALTNRVAPIPGPLSIAYEDDDLLLIDKPGNLAVHAGPGVPQDTLSNYLVHYYMQIGLAADIHLVNRLDRGTSGLMAVAKHSHGHERLIAQLHSGSFLREYLAVCEGVPPEKQGLIDLPLGPTEDSVIRREVRQDGSPARTHYRVLYQGSHRSLVALQLETGRTHQIRVHLAHLGCPLVGDFLYGQELPHLPNRFALHAAKIALRHPITGVQLYRFSPFPPELLALFEGERETLFPILEAFCEEPGETPHSPSGVVSR